MNYKIFTVLAMMVVVLHAEILVAGDRCTDGGCATRAQCHRKVFQGYGLLRDTMQKMRILCEVRAAKFRREYEAFVAADNLKVAMSLHAAIEHILNLAAQYKKAELAVAAGADPQDAFVQFLLHKDSVVKKNQGVQAPEAAAVEADHEVLGSAGSGTAPVLPTEVCVYDAFNDMGECDSEEGELSQLGDFDDVEGVGFDGDLEFLEADYPAGFGDGLAGVRPRLASSPSREGY